MCHKLIKETESEHDKFNNQKSGRGSQSITTGVMDKGLPSEPRSLGGKINFILIKYEQNVAKK